MKRNLLLVSTMVAALILSSACNKMSKEERALRDSLELLKNQAAQTLSENEEMDSIINDVLANFQQINAMEGSINIAPQGGELRQSQRARIEDNIRLINEKLQANRENIDKLNNQLKKSGNKNKSLADRVKMLEQQLVEHTEQILALTEELKRKNITIGVLDSMVVSLNENVSDLNQKNQKQRDEIARQDASLHTVKYCIGTNSDLKEMNILKGGQIVTDGYQSDYFTQIDMRRVTSIPLYSKKAELMTKHPTNSYTLIPGRDKQLTLEINNPQEFWSLSRILVVRIS